MKPETQDLAGDNEPYRNLLRQLVMDAVEKGGVTMTQSLMTRASRTQFVRSRAGSDPVTSAVFWTAGVSLINSVYSELNPATGRPRLISLTLDGSDSGKGFMAWELMAPMVYLATMKGRQEQYHRYSVSLDQQIKEGENAVKAGCATMGDWLKVQAKAKREDQGDRLMRGLKANPAW